MEGGNGAGRSGTERQEEIKANANWPFGRERRGRGCLMYLLSRCRVPHQDVMKADCRAEGQKATEPPGNLLSRFTDNNK